MVFALSTGHAIGLAASGAIFITFALVSSFVLPARYPDFPAPHRNLYLGICVLFFAGMIGAVLVFGKSEPESTASAAPPPASTTTTATTTSSTTTVVGNVHVGETLFHSEGCSGCHTLKAAGATGTVGPNLDDLKPEYATIVHQVENGGGGMPPFKSSMTMEQIQAVAAFVFTSTH